jgi:hypothetical protein
LPDTLRWASPAPAVSTPTTPRPPPHTQTTTARSTRWFNRIVGIRRVNLSNHWPEHGVSVGSAASQQIVMRHASQVLTKTIHLMKRLI